MTFSVKILLFNKVHTNQRHVKYISDKDFLLQNFNIHKMPSLSSDGLTSCSKDCTFQSEYRSEFQKKPYKSYKDHFEVPVPCSRSGFPQESHGNCGNRFIPNHLILSSTYREDYQPCKLPKPRPKSWNIMHSRPNHQFVDIDVKNCGYEKYLDIYATTKALDHREFSPKEVNHDAITVWDWFQIPKVRGRSIPLNVPISKRDLRDESRINQPKTRGFVPNKGLVSEYKEEFGHTSLSKPNFV